MESIDPRSVTHVMSRIRSAKGQANPYPLYAELRALGSVLPSPWGGKMLTGWGECNAVIRGRSWDMLDHRWRKKAHGERWRTVASQEVGRTLMVLNPPEHTLQRRMLGNIFNPGVLHALQSIVESIVIQKLDTLENAISSGGDADFPELVGEEIPVAVIGSWLGIPDEDYPLLRKLTHDQGYAQEIFVNRTQLARADEAAIGMRSYFTELVAGHRKHPDDSKIVSRWLRDWDAVEPDREVADSIVRHLATFFVMAGLETTSTLISTAVWMLLSHPDQLRYLQQHPDCIPNAVEEVLRYDPPVQFFSRVARTDVEVSGVHIPEGQLVWSFLGPAQHDPKWTPQPDKFDIHRQTRHLSFGGGAHQCIGAGLARLQTVILLGFLMERFPRLVISAVPEWEPRLAFRRIQSFRVSYLHPV